MLKSWLDRVLQIGIYLGLFIVAAVPLMMNSDFFFPFISPKAFVFRIAVEIIFLMYLLLAYRREEFRLSFSLIVYGLLAFVGINLLSSLLGINFYESFWGDMERSEGLITFLHLLGLFFIIASVLKLASDWHFLFDLFVFVSLPVGLIALGQAFGLQFISIVAGTRVTSTVGNAAFLAGYAIFNFWFALFLSFVRPQRYLKIYYYLLMALNLMVMYFSGTRGAILGMAAGVVVALFWVVRFSANKWLKRGLLLLLVLGLATFALLRMNREGDFVKNNHSLKRIAEISFTTRTAQTRFWTWGSAWESWQDRFLLGYGLEHFDLAFDKYFNPLIYQDEGSIVWFDRAHNIIFDRAVTSGVVGLVIYLALLFYPVWWLYKNYRRGKVDFALAMIFSVLLVVYFVQNLFVFDTIVTYIPWFLVLGFMHYLSESQADKAKKFVSREVYGFGFLIFLLLIAPIMYFANIKTAKANLVVVDAMKAAAAGNAGTALNKFTEGLDYNTYANQEYRIQLTEFIGQVNDSLQGETNDYIYKAVDRVDRELDKQIEESPKGRNYLLYIRHYLTTQILDVSRLQKILDIAPIAIASSPTRPHIYYEIGITNMILGRVNVREGRMDMAEKYFQEAEINFKKAIDLNPAVEESYLKMIILFMASDQTERLADYFAMMDEKKLRYKERRYLGPLAENAALYKQYEWAIKFYGELAQLEPTNIDNVINIALSLAYLGRDKEAIDLANEIASKAPELKAEADSFIAQVKSGFYQQN